jgi:uncharacterized protein (DUF1330 family)
MKAFVIFQATILDAEQYEHYKAAAAPSIAAAGGRYLVRGGNPVVLEGDPPTVRTVILEFPSRGAAEDWFRSDEYQAIRGLRRDAASASILLVDGYE